MRNLFSRFNYIDDGELFFSEVAGKGLYFQTKDYVTLPDNLQRDEPEYPVFQDVDTGEEFFAKEIRPSLHNRAIVRFAKTLVDKSLIMWPKDVIAIPPESSITLNELENYYEFGDAPENNTIERKAVLFSWEACIPGVSVRDYLDAIGRRGEINYNNPEIVKLARKILEAYSKLNKKGYLYLDFDLGRYHLTEEDAIYFEFSNLVYRTADTENVDWTHENRLERPWIPLEFAEPAVIQGNWKYADGRTQNYSLTALMFYLLFGRHAYYGSLMDNYSSDSELHYYEMFEDYHDMDVFIFDPDDSSNELGTFSHENKIIQLWETAPEQIKDAFIGALCTNE